MTLTKSFVNNCRNIGALRDFLCQAMDQVDEKDKEIAELKKKLIPCLNGDCILTCEVVEKYGKENAELKQKLHDAEMQADLAECAVTEYKIDYDKLTTENRRLKRALWLARAEIAHKKIDEYWPDYCHNAHSRIALLKWEEVERKCRAKAEEYK